MFTSSALFLGFPLHGFQRRVYLLIFLFVLAFPLESNLFLLLDGLTSTDSTISLQYVSSLKDTLSYILVFNKRLTLKCAILSPSRMQLRHISTTLYYIYQFSTHYDFAIS